MKFYIADAFATDLFGGNPAGVIFLQEEDDFPEEAFCVKVAAELRYSETVFVKRIDKKIFEMRYFTSTNEVDLCGHATIAAFGVMQQESMVEKEGDYVCRTKAGVLEIQIKDGRVFMDMAKPRLLKKIEKTEELEKIYQVLGLNYHEQMEKGLALKPQIITTGLPDIMLPVVDRMALDQIEPDMKALSELSRYYEVVGVHAFTVDCGDITCHARNFAPLYGIMEEAATGTSNGALTYYLYLNGKLGSFDKALYIQGEKMGRASEIYATFEIDCSAAGCEEFVREEARCTIQIGGCTKIVAEGNIRI